MVFQCGRKGVFTSLFSIPIGFYSNLFLFSIHEVVLRFKAVFFSYVSIYI